jgi:Ca2+-binding RTX toxin-like protein
MPRKPRTALVALTAALALLVAQPAAAQSPTPRLSITGGTAFEGGLVPFTLSLDRASEQPVSVDFITGDGTAVRGNDYHGRRGTITIPAGQTSATLSITSILDRLYENEERFRVELSNASGAQLDQHIDSSTIVNTLRSGRCANDVIGQKGLDVLTGSPAGDLMRGRLDHDVLFGLDGDDCINGEKGDDKLYGGDGNDVVDGGAGNDELKGDAGNDRLVGGRAFNRYNGGSGDDRIYARNGRAETVECGSGRDWVKADRRDRLRRCERVVRTGG